MIRPLIKLTIKQLMVVLLLIPFSQALASSPCHGAILNPITDVCWSCLFPLTIGSQPVVKGNHPDVGKSRSMVCHCKTHAGSRVGFSLGFWEPVSVVDVTRTPFCFVNLGGIQLPFKHITNGEQHTQKDVAEAFYHVHWYNYPLLSMLGVLTDAACMEPGGFDLLYLSELDPLWADDTLSFIIHPESVLFANSVAQAACITDALASTLHKPLDALFWCLGAQGSSYPLTGHVMDQAGGVHASTLLTERMAFKLHRELILLDGEPKASESICKMHPRAILPKSHYRYQMTYPIPTNTEPNGCKPFGASTATWEAGREYPYEGEDFGYLIFRKRTCCAF